MVLEKEENQDSGGSLNCLEKDLKTINVRNSKSQAKNKTAIPGMEFLGRSKLNPKLLCHKGRKEGKDPLQVVISFI
ncbi:hypothetical protein TNCV_2424951 [Trichonephila clavipes]|nr:hypothetical protein TNCV_2424951 [Trichonephila clavipes]